MSNMTIAAKSDTISATGRIISHPKAATALAGATSVMFSGVSVFSSVAGAVVSVVAVSELGVDGLELLVVAPPVVPPVDVVGHSL